MNRRRLPEENLMQRFCDLLGRQHFLAGFLDWVAGWLLPSAAAALPGGARRGRARLWPEARRLVLMAEGPGTEGEAPMAPRMDPSHAIEPEGYQLPLGTSHQKNRPTDRPLSEGEKMRRRRLSAICAEPQYWGMFGQPCRLLTGSDTMCPEGSVSGWFWKYQTPVGVIYYVDCCGKTELMFVTCNWTQEMNWCVAGKAGYYGRDIYTCTLAVRDEDMRTDKRKDPHDTYTWVEGVEYQSGVGEGSYAGNPDPDDPPHPD